MNIGSKITTLAILAAATCGAREAQPELNIEVHLYNYSTVSGQSTVVAEQGDGNDL